MIKEELDFAEIATMQRRIKELYRQGVTAISENGVHLSNDAFFNSFIKYETNTRNCNDYPFEHSAIYGGVEFFCISETKAP